MATRLRFTSSASTTPEGTVALSKKKLDAHEELGRDRAGLRRQDRGRGLPSPRRTRAALLANVKGIRVFIPASQTGVPKNGDMGAAAQDQTVQLKITEVNRARTPSGRLHPCRDR